MMQTNPLEGTRFKFSRPKNVGKAPGCFAINEEDGFEYLIKEAPISTSVHYTPPPGISTPHIVVQFFQEYITAPLYQLWLPDLSSSFELIPQAKATTILYGCSKLIPGFKDLYEHEQPLPPIKGFEDVIAACMFGAEFDYHGYNIGLVNRLSGKVDHGMSATNFYNDEYALLQSIARNFAALEYGSIPFNLGGFQAALTRTACTTAQTIKDIINSRISNLQDAGFVFSGLRAATALNNIRYHHKFGSALDARKFYIDAFITQKYTISRLIGVLELFKHIKISLPDIQFCDLIQDDPISLANKKGLKIGGLTAIEYAFRKGIPVNSANGKSFMRICIDNPTEVKGTMMLLDEIVASYLVLHTTPSYYDYTAGEPAAFFSNIQAKTYPHTTKCITRNSMFMLHLAALGSWDRQGILSDLASLEPVRDKGFSLSAETFLSHYDLGTLYRVILLFGEQHTNTSYFSMLDRFSDYICQLVDPTKDLKVTNLLSTVYELDKLSRENQGVTR